MTNLRDKTDQAVTGRSDATSSPEVVAVSSRRVKCDGGGALGHPLVYYEIGEKDFVDCLYCDRRFVLDGADNH
ncbi:MAG: zinc-finger domain-containing protein [Terricaulis sp.]